MAVLDTKRSEEGDKPFVYIIGSRMILDRLQEIANTIDQQTEDTITVHLLDADGEAGAEVCTELDIDVAQLPAVLLLESDESVYQDWYGEDLPAADQVVYTIQQLTGASA